MWLKLDAEFLSLGTVLLDEAEATDLPLPPLPRSEKITWFPKRRVFLSVPQIVPQPLKRTRFPIDSGEANAEGQELLKTFTGIMWTYPYAQNQIDELYGRKFFTRTLYVCALPSYCFVPAWKPLPFAVAWFWHENQILLERWYVCSGPLCKAGGLRTRPMFHWGSSY